MNNDFEKPKPKITRRQFLAGGLAAAAAAVGITKYRDQIVEHIKKIGPDESIESHKGVGVISKKIHTPAETHENFPVGQRGITPLLNRMGNKQENWSVEVKIDGRNLMVPVSKQQFDILVEGKEYAIVYKTEIKNQQGWVDSIAGVKVKY